MNLLFTAQGSRGDVYPMITLAEHFRREGHEVHLVTNMNFRTLLEHRGIPGSSFKVDMTEAMAQLNCGLKSILPTLKWVQGTLDEQMEALLDLSDGADCIVSTNNEFSTPTVCEYRGIPAVRLAYLPVLPGSHPPPLLPPQHLPSVLNRAAWKALDAGLDALALKKVNAWRRKLGLEELRSLGPQLAREFYTCMAYKRELSPPQPDWDPERYTYTGYCFDQQSEPLEPELESFLNRGAPPVYIGFGSVSLPDPVRFSETAAAAAAQAGVRLIISRGWTGLGDRVGNSRDIHVCGECSHSALFPRLAGVCHHGGAGTTHRAARAGIPQLILPVFADQFFWGNRIHDLGLGPRSCRPQNLTVNRFAALLQDLTANPLFREHSRAFAETFTENEGAVLAYEQIMSLLRERKSCTA